MRKYVHCLSHRYALQLLVCNLFGRLPNGMGALAIVLFLRAHNVPYGKIGAVAALYGVCSAVGGPVLGRIVDKRGQPIALLGGASGSGLGFFLLAAVGTGPFPVVLLAVALAGFFMPPLEPALRSMWPSVMPDAGSVEVAYALDSALQNLLFIAGPLLVVGLVDVTSTTAALVVIGAFGILGTLTFAAIPPVRTWQGETVTRDWAGPLRSGLLLLLLAGMLCLGAVIGVFNVATVAYSEKVNIGSFSGVMLGAFSVGSMTGGLVYGVRTWSGDVLKRLVGLLLAMALFTWPLVLVPRPTIIVILMVVAGVSLAPVLTCSYVLIAKIAPRGTVTEAFAWITALFVGGSAAGSALAGFVLSHTDRLAATFTMAGLASTMAFLVLLLALLRGSSLAGQAVADTAQSDQRVLSDRPADSL